MLAAQAEPQGLLENAAKWLLQQPNIDLVIIYPYDPAQNQLTTPISAGRNIPDDLPDTIRLGSGLYGDVGSSRQARQISAPRTGIRGDTAPGLKTGYVMPLIYASTLIGVLAVQSVKEDAYPDALRPSLDDMAAVIAAQTATVQQIVNTRQAIGRFDRFQVLSQRLTATLDVVTLLQDIVEAAREMLDTQMSILLEVRENDDVLHPVTWSGIDDATANLLQSHYKEDLKGLVAWARRPARTHNLLTDQRTAHASEAVVAGMLSELAVPVVYGETLFGVLAVETNVYRDFTDEEMTLLTSLAAQAGVALHNARLFQILQKTNSDLENAITELGQAHEAQIRAYEAELETARAIQESLLPQEMPPVPQISLVARAIPARQVSGDFYQYFLMPGGKLGVAVGDVTGKGIPAALLMAVTTTAMRDEVTRYSTPTALMDELNLRLIPRMKQNFMNSALTLAVYDPAARTIEVVNGGMVQPYLFDGTGWHAVEVGGYPIGVSERTRYRSQTLPFEPGSFLLFTTDGVIETQNLQGTFFDFEGLEALLQPYNADHTPETIISAIFKAVEVHAEGQEAQDDITVVCMKAL